MQAQSTPPAAWPEKRPYTALMVRKNARAARPRQGARVAELRRAAGLTQVELAHLIGEPQQNIAYWEQSDKPPRSDVLQRLAKALGVSVEDILDIDALPPRQYGPMGKVRRVFDEVSKLPRRQQDKIVEFVSALVDQYKRKAS
jgi:transcriptional regulator with XRE-family HTH domain